MYIKTEYDNVLRGVSTKYQSRSGEFKIRTLIGAGWECLTKGHEAFALMCVPNEFVVGLGDKLVARKKEFIVRSFAQNQHCYNLHLEVCS